MAGLEGGADGALADLHEATRTLIQGSSRDQVAQAATEAAEDVLGLEACVVFLLDGNGVLVPAATTPGAREALEGRVAVEPGEGTIGRAFESADPIVGAEVPVDGCVYRRDATVESQTAFPLGDHGAFVVGSTGTGGLRTDDTALARVLAANTRATLDRLARERELQERKRRIEALHGVAAEFETCRTEGEVYRLTVDAAEDLLEFSICAVDEVEGGTLKGVVTSSEAPPEGFHDEKSVHDGIYGKTYRTGETQVVEDVRNAPEAKPLRSEYRSALSVPIGEFGVFQAAAETPGAFDDEDRELAELLVTHATEALRRVRRERAVEELHAATRELMRAETEERVAGVAVETARGMPGLPLTSIRLHEEEDDLLRPAAHTDAVEDLLDGVPTVGPGEGIVWDAFSTREVEVRDDVCGDPDANPGTGIGSRVVLPLGSHGVLVCDSTGVEEFDSANLTLAEVLAENTRAALDRTEREQLLRSRNREIERQNERLEKFASVVSHDLRGPLNVATGRLELLREECESDHVEAVERAHSRIDDLVDSLLTLARRGQSIGDPEPVPLGEAVDEAWAVTDGADASLVVVDDLPAIRADRTRLTELLENLFGNAIDHAGPDVTVTVGTARDGFYVADDGTGIPPDRRGQVFEWGHTTTDDGTGLGLAIVEEIVRAHGWEVEVTGSAGGGARFEVTGVERAAT